MADIALTERLLEDYDAHQRRHGFSFWAVIERSSGTLIGDAGLYRTPAGEVELGYTLGAAVVGPRLRHRGGRPLAGGRVRGAAGRRGDRARRAGQPRLAARAREARDARDGERIAFGRPHAVFRGQRPASSASIPSRIRWRPNSKESSGVVVGPGLPRGRDRREALGVEVVLPELLALAPPLLVADAALALGLRGLDVGAGRALRRSSRRARSPRSSPAASARCRRPRPGRRRSRRGCSGRAAGAGRPRPGASTDGAGSGRGCGGRAIRAARASRRRRRLRVLGVDGVEHQLEQLGLAGDVAVERHRADAEPLRDPPHRRRLEPFGVGELDRGGDDPLDGQAGLRARARRARGGPRGAGG